MRVKNGGPNVRTEEVVLFAFDDYSIPLRQGVRLHLVAKQHGSNIVMGTGDSSAPDSKMVVYYGTVLRVGDELWMWYLAQGDDNKWHQRVCLAKSRDGYRWEKPNLGLVEYKGNTNNNLVDLNGGRCDVLSGVVFYEPEEPNPEHRFKMAFESRKYKSELAVAFSGDGIRWKESPNNPVGPIFETAGGTKFNRCYYLTGQNEWGHFPPSRRLETHISYDFEHWTQSTCLGLCRQNVPPRPMVYHESAGEQAHLGAALWNRGNVIIGLYGQWHGHPTNDLRLVSMDLGLVVSNDALHYREPIPDFRMVPAAWDGWGGVPFCGATAHFPALIQGQGFENIGNETLFWYGAWLYDRNGVRVATWPRDRLGYLQSFWGAKQGSHFISCPLDLEDKPARVYLNVDGVSEYNKLSVEVMDEELRKVAGYSSNTCIAPEKSGFYQSVKWKNHEMIERMDRPIRIRVNFEGVRPEDLKVYAIYLEPTD